jgi:DNA polymerase-1
LGRRVFGEDFKITETVKSSNTSQMDLFGSPRAAAFELQDETEEFELINFKTIQDTEHLYHLVDTPAARQSLIVQLNVQSAICFDTESTSTDANIAELVGLSFSFKKGEAYYVPLSAEQNEAITVLKEFESVLVNPAIQKIGQNIKYDILLLKWYGIEVKGVLFDTMLAHYLIDADARHGMDVLAENYLQYSPVSITELIGKKGKTQGSMRDVAVDVVKEYAAEDADITLQLKEVFEPMLIATQASDLASKVENPLVYVLADMEFEGVKIDKEVLAQLSIELAVDIAKAEKEIFELAGVKFNIASPKQLGEVLFDKLQLDPKAKKTKTGQYQTGEDILSLLAPKHEIVQHILSFRTLQKLKSTYVDALPEMINPKTGRVHTSYNQAVAATGRLSSNNPNLQNIPIKTARGREVRKAFIAKDANHVIISADYSQIELRVIAEMAKEENMLQAFVNGLDIHTATAANIYSVAVEEVTAEQRRNAKAVNFGIIYGQSAFGLSQNLNIPRKEAAEIIEQYFIQFPRIKNYMAQTIDFARENGYVETIMKRRRYLRDINSANATVRGFAERNAINAPIQGSAADMIKMAMIKIHATIKAQGLQSKMTMQVHDELVFEVPLQEVDQMKVIIETNMKNALPLEVPILVEIGIGENWLAAH